VTGPRSGTLRALPTLLRVGFAEAVAYRAELLVWVLSTTMPLVMLALFSAVARDAPFGRFGQKEFVAYFVSTFIVRQLTSSWVAWDMNFEIRQGTLALRLLRPVHPILAFAAGNIAVQPLRLVVALPVAAIALVAVGSSQLPGDPALWAIWCAAMAGGWLITYLAGFAIGCLAFFTESSLRLMDLWLTFFFVFSGYMVPVELFPPSLRVLSDWLPFRYQIGLPVEIMTSAHGRAEALAMLARQWIWVVVLGVAAARLWRSGVRRFAAYGG
jgi:ABC-2 type transport system permease protein